MYISFVKWVENIDRDPEQEIMDKLYYVMDKGLSLGQGAWITDADIRTLERILYLGRNKLKTELNAPSIKPMYQKYWQWKEKTKPVSLAKAVRNGGNIQEPIIQDGQIAVSEELYTLLRYVIAYQRLSGYVASLKNRMYGKIPTRDFYAVLLVIKDFIHEGQYFHQTRTPSLAK